MSGALRQPGAYNYVLMRVFIAAFGCVAVIWGLVTLPTFWRQSTLERTAQRIVNGEPFKAGALAGELPIIETVEKSAFCAPAALRSAAIVRLRMAEEASSEGPKEKSDAQMNVATNSIRQSLSCSPADPFLWLALYWLDRTQREYVPEDLKYLGLSYQLGPNEGWIALKRNRAAFAAFQQLPPDLAERALREFVSLLENEFYEQAADIFTGPAWPVRNVIVPRLKDVAEDRRRFFAQILSSRDYDVELPGIKFPEKLPWQRER